MPEQRPFIPDWPDEYNSGGTLFADVIEHGRPFYDLPVPTPAPDKSASAIWLTMSSNDKAYAVEKAFIAEVAMRLAGVAEKTNRDDLVYDALVGFPSFPDYQPTFVQVRYRSCANGKADFPVGVRDRGRRGGGRDHRQFQRSRGMLHVFALATWWRDALRWYIIPAKRIDQKVLRITPGCRRVRRGRLEPEAYVATWHHLAPFVDPVGSVKGALADPVGSVNCG